METLTADITALQHLPWTYRRTSYTTEIQQFDMIEYAYGERIRLYINDELELSSADEWRYHCALTMPLRCTSVHSVVVFGGGDGCIVRDLLTIPTIERIVVVDSDPLMIQAATQHLGLKTMNQNSLTDPRVDICIADALTWLQTNAEHFDGAVVNLPSPTTMLHASLYDEWVIKAIIACVDGPIATQCCSWHYTPEISSAIWERWERHTAVIPYRTHISSRAPWAFGALQCDRHALTETFCRSPLAHERWWFNVQAATTMSNEQLVQSYHDSPLERVPWRPSDYHQIENIRCLPPTTKYIKRF